MTEVQDNVVPRIGDRYRYQDGDMWVIVAFEVVGEAPADFVPVLVRYSEGETTMWRVSTQHLANSCGNWERV